jgi:hypothetical protein
MAVTIDEMQVDVKDASPQPAASSSNAQSGGNVDLRAALAVIAERELRLKAD